MFKLDDRVAIVTGGAKGIGMSYSAALADVGARVVVADIDPSAVRDTASSLNEEYPGRVIGVDLDVSRQESIEAMISRVEETWGRLDILVNNAALFSAIPVRDSAWGIPNEEWDRVMEINVRGIYACTEASLGLMSRQGWGRVINIASGLSFKGSHRLIHYAASKGAVVNLTRSMAQALAAQGITVNAIAPGATDSPTVLEARAARAAAGAPPPSPSPLARREQRLIDRPELPEDLIGTLIYLASPASSFVTGQTIVVDGGSYLH
jgi:NAD(P)-dependent dehydrogenase (short-subunit alcohol dehydrogenase family)